MLFQKQTLTTYCIVRKHNFFLSLPGITSTVHVILGWVFCVHLYILILNLHTRDLVLSE